MPDFIHVQFYDGHMRLLPATYLLNENGIALKYLTISSQIIAL